MLGAAFVVYDDTRDMVAGALNCTRFYRNESCGKCVPCRLGSQKLVQIGHTLLAHRAAAAPGGPAADDLARDVKEITRALQLTSICGLGYVAPIPLATALAYFPGQLQKQPGT